MNSLESPVVILGAGFVGLFTALHLERQKNVAPTLPVVLIDRNDRFCFKPLLYEYFTGEMESDQLIPSYKELLAGSDARFLQTTVESIDLEKSQVHLAGGDVQPYSQLLLALGCVPAFFAAGAQENTLTFQSRADADKLKRHLMDCLQRATPTEIQEYKEFIYSCCDCVAKATGSGLLGTGSKVSAGEAIALQKLKAVLSL